MLAADRGVGRAPEKRKKQRAAGAGGGVWACRASLSCPGIVRVRLGDGRALHVYLSEAHGIKVLIRPINVYKHSDWSAKSSDPA